MSLTRIVKLSISSSKQVSFEQFFGENREIILSFEGCKHVELLKSSGDIYFTYSIWDDETSLNAYRNSTPFEKIWSKTKTFFSGKPEAWSLDKIIYE